MLWNFFRAAELPSVAELMRRAHSRWLTAALRPGRAYPRIPVRPVSQGGFSHLARLPDGRHWAEAWWAAALQRVDPHED